jgi:EmrB/QacA subfamily drug resistance transporter
MRPAMTSGGTREVDRRVERRRWFALVVLSVGQLMVALDSTVVNVALATIQRELHFSHSSLAWVVNSYLITYAGLLLLGGRLGDLLGRKRVFLWGLLAFTAASLLCGLSWSAPVLIAARFGQGVGGALMTSMVLGILGPMFPDGAQRTKALGIFAAVTLGGVALGLPVGGTLVESLGWHWIFFINVPVGVATFVLSRRLLASHAGLGIRAGADVLGALLITVGPMLLVYALIETSTEGWFSPYTVVPFALAVMAIPLFVAVEARVRSPIVPLRVFSNSSLIDANIIRFFFGMAALGQGFLGSQFLQEVLHYTPRQAGLAYLPNSVIVALVSLFVVPRLLHRFSRISLITVGLVSFCGGLVRFSLVPLHAHYAESILPATILIGFGIGLFFTPSVGLALANVAPSESGIASGLTNVSTQMAGSIGVALVATISASWTTHQLHQHVSSTAALASGFHLAFRVLAMSPLLGLVATAWYRIHNRATTGAELSTESALTEVADVGMID